MAARHPYQRGDVILVSFPFGGPAGVKDRPVIVLSTDEYHDNWDEILVVAATSRQPLGSRRSDSLLQNRKGTGLQQAS
jgi:mRNA-degrading endonuclease toxin of MazEF toxin-antitoxin module